MSGVVLYGMDQSPPVRACLLTLYALDIPFEYKICNLMKKEHLSVEFLKRNPQHTIPILDDNGTWIWDSHAICSYLVDKYGKDDRLYPKDLAKRAVVNQRLYFDASILYMSMHAITNPFFQRNVADVPQEKIVNVLEGYEHFENFLKEGPYLTGKNLTIADFCCVGTLFSLSCIVNVDETKFPKIVAWNELLTKLDYYEKVNSKDLKERLNKIFSKLNILSA